LLQFFLVLLSEYPCSFLSFWNQIVWCS
jgi:hypothetical protein